MTIANRKVTSLAVLLLVALFSIWGCPKCKLEPEDPEGGATSMADYESSLGKPWLKSKLSLHRAFIRRIF